MKFPEGVRLTEGQKYAAIVGGICLMSFALACAMVAFVNHLQQ